MRFNGSGLFNQSWGKRQWNESTDKKVNDFITNVRPYKDKIIFTSKNFSDVKITKPSMVYIDPPYSSVEDENGNMIYILTIIRFLRREIKNLERLL